MTTSKAAKAGKVNQMASDQGAATVTDTDALSYEQARDELVATVKRLEAGGLTLEQSLELWERGEKLATICERWLEGARARLTEAMAAREDGEADGDTDDAGAAAAKAPF
jgi:exodeoxyribonuclease VII small subunit